MMKTSREFRIIATMIIISLFNITISLSAEMENRDEIVLAEYRDGVITRTDFNEEFERIPLMYRSRFSTLSGQQELLNSMVISELFYQKARELGVDQREAVKERIEQTLTGHHTTEFRQRGITDEIVITPEEIKEYYEMHINRFTENPNTVIRYIMTEDEEQAYAALDALQEGNDFLDVMNRYSVNSFSKRHQGIIRNIRSNGYIAGVGMDDDLDDAISEAPLDTWIGPLTTESGIHLFQVTERKPSRVKPIDEVEEEIISRLRPARELEKTEEVYQALKDKYDIEIDEEVLNHFNPFERPDEDMATTILVSANEPGLQFTVADIMANIQNISPQERAQLNNPEHKLDMLNDMVKNRLFAQEAKIRGYTDYVMEKPEVQIIRRNIILTELFNELVVSRAVPTEEEIVSYYNENIESYTSRENRSIQLFLFDTSREAKRARNIVSSALEEGNEEAIQEVIEGSLFTNNNGRISNIQRDQEIPRLGKDENIHRVIWSTELDELSSVNRSDDSKHFFLRVLEDNPEHTIPLEDAEERITFMLTRELREKHWNMLQEELKEEYDLVLYPDRLATMFTAKELFNKAEEALQRNRYTEAIDYYDQIIEYHKNNDDDYKALFMKAFLLAEEMDQTEDAISIFKHVLEDYPVGDLHESAEYMIKTLEGEYDAFGELD